MIEFTFWERLTQPQGTRHRATWEALVGRLSIPRTVRAKHLIPGFSLATFRNNYRLKAGVERVHGIGLDFDKHLDWDLLKRRFRDVACFAHTTWQSTPEAPRARVFLRLSRAVTGPEYERVYKACAGVAERGGLVVDKQASDPSRLWYLPAIPEGGRFAMHIGEGPVVNVEGALEEVPAEPPPPPPVPLSGTRVTSDVEERAAKYLARCNPAISGQGGHLQTFVVCQHMVRGFGLDESTAFRLLQSWNARCEPPWKDWELRRKVREAAVRGTMAEGALRDRPRRSA